jgi:hypothetical protein
MFGAVAYLILAGLALALNLVAKDKADPVLVWGPLTCANIWLAVVVTR